MLNLSSREAEDAARETRELLESRDVASLAVTGLSSAGGVVVAQTFSDTVVGALDLNLNPESLTDYAAAIGSKGVVAVVFGFAAAQLSGLALIGASFMAIGALASAGADALEALLMTAPLGDDNPLGGSAVANSSSSPRTTVRGSTPKPTASVTRNASSTQSSSFGAATAGGSGF